MLDFNNPICLGDDFPFQYTPTIHIFKSAFLDKHKHAILTLKSFFFLNSGKHCLYIMWNNSV